MVLLRIYNNKARSPRSPRSRSVNNDIKIIFLFDWKNDEGDGDDGGDDNIVVFFDDDDDDDDDLWISIPRTLFIIS
mgnify:CR=1 FL=1